jgi:hypothetical protein
MSTQELVNYYAILLDKWGSPNLIEDEIVDTLNHAQMEYLNRLFPDSQGGIANVETDSNTVANIKPLIYTISTTMNGTTGLVTEATLNTALQTESGDANSNYFRVLSVNLTSDGIIYPVRYIRQNNLWATERNFFKKPEVTNPRYTTTGKGLRFYPIDATKTLSITLVKNPKKLSLAPVVDPEFDDYTLYQILMIALQLGGISIRDGELLQTIQMNTVQGK